VPRRIAAGACRRSTNSIVRFASAQVTTANEALQPERLWGGGDRGGLAAGRYQAVADAVRQPSDERNRQCHTRAEPEPAAGSRCDRQQGGSS
jgi:hypothetical protein